MNYFNVSIFVIVTSLITTGEFFSLRKNRKRHEWKIKSTKDRKIVSYAKDAVKLFNEKYHSTLRLIQVVAARRIYEENSKHYNLKLFADNDCKKNDYKCLEEIIVDIFKNYKHPHKLTFFVHNYWRQNDVNLLS